MPENSSYRGYVITDAIILKTVVNGESNRFVYFLSPDMGVGTCYAFGAQRIKSRFCSSIVPFGQMKLFLHKSGKTGLFSLKDVSEVKTMDCVQKDLRSIYVLSFYSEVVRNTLMNSFDYKKYYFLLKYAMELLEREKTPEKSLLFFMTKLIVLHGQEMLCSVCRECGKAEGGVYYSSGSWGFFCKDHISGMEHRGKGKEIGNSIVYLELEDAKAVDFYTASKYLTLKEKELKLKNQNSVMRVLFDIVCKIYGDWKELMEKNDLRLFF